MSFVLVVQMKAKEGMEDRAKDLARELAEATRTESGCEAYVPCQNPDDPRSFVFFERYVDKAAFEEHGATDHFKRLALADDGLFGLMESRDRTFYETL